MLLIQIIFIIVLVGVILWAVNTYLAQYMQPSILKILNVATVVILIIWLIYLVFPGVFGSISTIRIGGRG